MRRFRRRSLPRRYLRNSSYSFQSANLRNRRNYGMVKAYASVPNNTIEYLTGSYIYSFDQNFQTYFQQAVLDRDKIGDIMGMLSLGPGGAGQPVNTQKVLITSVYCELKINNLSNMNADCTLYQYICRRDTSQNPCQCYDITTRDETGTGAISISAQQDISGGVGNNMMYKQVRSTKFYLEPGKQHVVKASITKNKIFNNELFQLTPALYLKGWTSYFVLIVNGQPTGLAANDPEPLIGSSGSGVGITIKECYSVKCIKTGQKIRVIQNLLPGGPGYQHANVANGQIESDKIA